MKRYVTSFALTLLLLAQEGFSTTVKLKKTLDLPVNQVSYLSPEISADGKTTWFALATVVQNERDGSSRADSYSILEFNSEQFTQKFLLPDLGRVGRFTILQNDLFVHGYDKFTKINTTDGRVDWVVPMEIQANAVVSPDQTIYQSVISKPSINRLDYATGNVVANFTPPAALPKNWYLWGVIKAGAAVIASISDEASVKRSVQVSTIGENQNIFWNLPIHPGYDGVADINPDGTILLADYISDEDPDKAIARRTLLTAERFGQQSWTYEKSGNYVGAGSQSYYFALSNLGKSTALVRLDRANGDIKWQSKLAMSSIVARRSVLELDDKLLYADRSLVIFDLATGKKLAEYVDPLHRDLQIAGGFDQNVLVYATQNQDNQSESIILLAIE